MTVAGHPYRAARQRLAVNTRTGAVDCGEVLTRPERQAHPAIPEPPAEAATLLDRPDHGTLRGAVARTVLTRVGC